MSKFGKHERAIRTLIFKLCEPASIIVSFENCGKHAHVKVCLTNGIVRYKYVYTRNDNRGGVSELDHIERDLKRILKGVFHVAT